MTWGDAIWAVEGVLPKFGSITPVLCWGPPPRPKGGSIIPEPPRKFDEGKFEFPAW